MPKPYTFPTLFDESLQISITKLKEWEYFIPEQIKSGTLTWSRNGNTTGRMSIRVNTLCERPYIELDYKYKDEPRNYRVWLVSVPSNLGRGDIWYFLCPQTNKRCRKLYSIGGYFLHREAFMGCMYKSQAETKPKGFFKTFITFIKIDDLYDLIEKKHFKKTYNGKPTKRYLRIMEQIEKIEGISQY